MGEIDQRMELWCSDYDNVYEHIKHCLDEAILRNIEANVVIVKKGFAVTQGFYSPDMHGIFPPMICGLKVIYTNNGLPFDANFIITKSDDVINEYDKLLKENEELKEKIRKIREVSDE